MIFLDPNTKQIYSEFIENMNTKFEKMGFDKQYRKELLIAVITQIHDLNVYEVKEDKKDAENPASKD